MDLSGDKVGIQEIYDGLDSHEDNRQKFNLPSRLIAKKFLFRLIYGGSAYSYANDNEFTSVSKSERFWQEVIDATYYKYRGLGAWHTQIVQEVSQKGRLIIPTGREYIFSPVRQRGKMEWPRTKILNYPVQGYAADLVMIARVSAHRRLKDKAVFISTVHDDLELDVDNDPELLYTISIELENVFSDVAANVKKIYGHEMKVPLAGEVSFGMNLANMEEFDRRKGVDQFKGVLS